jgi:folylpolyglutamate synthase/dihydropteroate synthase
VILGLAREKDLAGILKTLMPEVDRVLCTSVGTPLHRTPGQIRDQAVRRGLVAETAATPPEALARALAHAQSGGWVLAIGSLYLAGELRPLLR